MAEKSPESREIEKDNSNVQEQFNQKQDEISNLIGYLADIKESVFPYSVEHKDTTLMTMEVVFENQLTVIIWNNKYKLINGLGFDVIFKTENWSNKILTEKINNKNTERYNEIWNQYFQPNIIKVRNWIISEAEKEIYKK